METMIVELLLDVFLDVLPQQLLVAICRLYCRYNRGGSTALYIESIVEATTNAIT